MNTIRNIQALNKRELENVVPPSASWHTDYRDTAFVFIGGLSFDLSEGDVVTIFSQFGEPTWIKLQRDKETGKSKGYAWLKYEDQRSTDLAVDNLGGATILGRTLRVDHTRYQRKEGQEEEDEKGNVHIQGEARELSSSEKGKEKRPPKERSTPPTKQEQQLQELLRDHDEEDPMKQYLIEEKRKEIAEMAEHGEKGHSQRHRHRRHRDRSRDRDNRDSKERKYREGDRDRDRGDRDDREYRHRRRD